MQFSARFVAQNQYCFLDKTTPHDLFPMPAAPQELAATGSKGSRSVVSVTCFDSQGNQISKPEVIVQSLAKLAFGKGASP